MRVQEAIVAYSQSEKIKSGLVWISHALELAAGLSGPERQGAERMIKVIIQMILQEVGLADRLTVGQRWGEIESHIDRGVIMINSGVALESVVHFTQALSQVTNIGQRSMAYLKEHGLL